MPAKNREEKKMKVRIIELAEILERKFKGKTFPGCDCRNGHPATGWEVIGHPGLTRAIKLSGLPYNNFWSGSNPTPSTQAPREIVEEADLYI